MTKQEFLAALKLKLSGLPEPEVEERLSFYGEMIDDRMEEGLTETEAVSDIGSVEDVANQIIADIPFARIAKERIKPNRKLKAWEIVLLVLGSPMWLSVGLVALAVVLALYVVLWALVIASWSVFAALVVSGVALIGMGAYYVGMSRGVEGLLNICMGLASVGLSIFMFFGCRAATKGIAGITKKIAPGMKKCFVKKGASK